MTKDCCKTKKCGGGGAQDKACAAAAQPPSCCDSDSGKKCSVEKEPCCSSKKHEGVAAATITSGVGGVGGVGHSCCGSGVGGKAVGHHDHNTAEVDSDENNSNRLCLAVIRENGVDVVIFDAEGVPRTFRTTGADLQKLCFRSHGYDDMLTPCFDETGKHGAPEESCFCGIDTPHLHAHVRDPKMCDNATADDDKAKFSSDKIGYLASQVLHPTRNDKEDNIPLIHIPVSESMPNMCNFQEALRASTSNNGSDASLCHRPGSRRVHQVQHDDHVDYLVHNAEADQLHLEHACDTCGSNDVHGKFHAVGKRRLSSVQLHFFSVSHRPFNLLDCLTDIFELSSDRVNAVENILPHKSTTETLHHHHATTAMATPTKTADQKKMNAVRSTFKCTQICCASEVPMIHAVLQPVKGIDNIRINVPLKQVLIDHDPGSVTAAELRAAMHQFGCSVMRDGGASVAKRTTGRSQFYVQNICCASEIPAILRIVEPLAGVKNVSINTTTKTVYVDHELDTLTATQICAALNAQGFGAQVRVDAGDAAAHASSARSTFVKSTLTISNDVTDPDTETLTTFLQAFVDSSQLEAFVVDVPTKSIFVVHNPFSLTAERIAKLVSERTQLEAIVSLDGADPAIWTFPHDLQQDCIDATEDLHLDEGFTYPRVTVMISGLLWIISMLSLIGGPW